MDVPRILILVLCALGLQGISHADEIVFKDAAGRVITKEQLKGATGQFKWEIFNEKPVPDAAEKLHGLGADAGSRGDYAAALRYFEQAAKLAPDWPYPPYDAAYTYLLAKNDAKALKLYQKVDKMAPRGFFTVKTAVWTLQLEQQGALPKGTYLRYLSLEWTESPKEKLKIATDLATKVPNFTPAWLTRSELESIDQKRLEYLERGLKLNSDVSTKNMLLLNQAAVLFKLKKKQEAVRILGTLALDPRSPPDAEALAKQSLAMMVAHWNE